MKKQLLVLGLSSLAYFASAQTDTTKTTTSTPADTTNSASLADLDLAALMDVKVVSASKKAESAFDAPLSIGNVSRDEIKRSGATNIVEALRLIPGLVVTEHTNGNYDVSIRGLNNLPLNSILSNGNNSITLVMIDGRPVYNYFNGGTFWESLPIDLNDVEKIEVVRGPAQALYGPNAASGVINIITRKPQKDGLYAVANVQGGLAASNPSGYKPGAQIYNGSVGYKAGKFDFIVSGNYQNRTRFENTYYSWPKDNKESVDSLRYYVTGLPPTKTNALNETSNISERYPEPNLAQRKFGYNAFVNFAATEKINIGVSAGGQNSIAQGAFVENLVTPLNTRTSISNYVDLRARIHGLSAQIGYQGGTQDASKGFNGYKYNFGTLDATAEYEITLSRFSIKPGFNYRSATYDDSKYANIAQNEGFINGAKSLTNVAGSLRLEYDDKKVFRAVAAGRLDSYNAPKDPYFSYEIAAYVKPSDKHLIRFVISRAYRGPTMYDVYGSQTVPVGLIGVAPGIALQANAKLKGDNNLKLQKVDLFELGYRAKATDFLYFDLDLFYQISRDYNLLTGVPQIVDFANGQIIIGQTIRNINLVTYQRGATFAANLALKKVQIKPFVTMQYTALECSPVDRDSATVPNNTTNIGDSRNTPKFFGGFYANYQATSKLNINLNGYYFGPYTYTNLFANPQLGGASAANGNVNVNGKFIMNLKVGYKILDKLEIFINARNLFNATSYEFAKTDATSGMYMIGASFEY